MKLVLNSEFNLYEKEGQAFCDSLQIAETFEKRHDRILRAIEDSLSLFIKIGDPNFGETNFFKSTYNDSQNKKRPMYLLTRDGFSYTVMGFTGEKAAKFKIAYINRFNQMGQFIQSLLTTKIERPEFTDAIKEAYEEPKPYHFSTETNLLYRIVLGVDAKKFREINGLEKGVVIKPYLTLEQIKAIEVLQRVDVGLHEAGLVYEERKEILVSKYQKMRLKIAM